MSLTSLVCCLLLSSWAYAEVPHLVRYQGQAVDSQGVPLEGPYTLTFRLYDAQTAGTKVWEEIQANVPLAGGHFSILLGQVTPLTAMDWSQPRWLSVQVGTDSELAPRQRITSVPLALRAGLAEKAQQADQLTVPIAPTLITPQGSGSGLDADTVDGSHATDLLNRTNHTGTQLPSTINPQGSGSGLDADTLDGVHASAFAVTTHTHPLKLVCRTVTDAPGCRTSPPLSCGRTPTVSCNSNEAQTSPVIYGNPCGNGSPCSATIYCCRSE